MILKEQRIITLIVIYQKNNIQIQLYQNLVDRLIQ